MQFQPEHLLTLVVATRKPSFVDAIWKSGSIEIKEHYTVEIDDFIQKLDELASSLRDAEANQLLKLLIEIVSNILNGNPSHQGLISLLKSSVTLSCSEIIAKGALETLYKVDPMECLELLDFLVENDFNLERILLIANQLTIRGTFKEDVMKNLVNQGLDSEKDSIRTKSFQLMGSLSFTNRDMALDLAEVLIEATSDATTNLKCLLSRILWDLHFLFPSVFSDDLDIDVVHHLINLNASSTGMETITVYGICRLLVHSSEINSEEHESLISSLVSILFAQYSPAENLTTLIQKCFEQYTGKDKDQHQLEIANASVLIAISDFEDDVNLFKKKVSFLMKNYLQPNLYPVVYESISRNLINIKNIQVSYDQVKSLLSI